MSQAHSISAKKPYGLTRVCEAWRVPRSTVYAQCAREARAPTTARSSPMRPM